MNNRKLDTDYMEYKPTWLRSIVYARDAELTPASIRYVELCYFEELLLEVNK